MGDKGFVGWKIDPDERGQLIARFPPTYAEIVVDHVTHRPEDAPLPPVEAGRIVGRVDDGTGVEAMVVEIAGGVRRPDGSAYHITWSLGPGREAVESNAVIAERGWTALPAPVEVRLIPAS